MMERQKTFPQEMDLNTENTDSLQSWCLQDFLRGEFLLVEKQFDSDTEVWAERSGLWVNVFAIIGKSQFNFYRLQF